MVFNSLQFFSEIFIPILWPPIHSAFGVLYLLVPYMFWMSDKSDVVTMNETVTAFCKNSRYRENILQTDV